MGILKPMTEKKSKAYGALNHDHANHNKTLIIHTKCKSYFAFRGFMLRGFANLRCHTDIKLKSSLNFAGHSSRFSVALYRNGVVGNKK